MDKQSLLNKVLHNSVLKKIYYLYGRNQIKIKNFTSFARLKNCVIKGNSDDKVIIGNETSMKNCVIDFSSFGHGGNTLIIGEKCSLQDSQIVFLDSGNYIEIGDECSFGSNCKFVSGEGKRIIIKSGCLFSYDIEVRNTDSHSIYSKGIRINTAEDIVVMENVWVAQGTLITKGAKIEQGCMIGAKAIYGRSVEPEPNCIYAGVPAKRIKQNITWDIRRTF